MSQGSWVWSRFSDKISPMFKVRVGSLINFNVKWPKLRVMVGLSLGFFGSRLGARWAQGDGWVESRFFRSGLRLGLDP